MSAKLPSLITEEKVQFLEGEFLKQPQADCPVVHRFGPGIYIREVTISAGVFSIGHRQTTTHLNIMLAGRVTMVMEDGSHVDVVAPQTFVSGPGRKIGYIHETMVWQNVYATDETDIEKLEAMFLDKSDTWKNSQRDKQLLLSFNNSEDVADFYAAIEELGYDADTVRQQSENQNDQMEMPYGNYKFMVSDSKIEGKGVFATGPISAGEPIGPARIAGLRTPLGRYTNHAKNPNAMMILLDNDDICMVATREISGCKGGDLGEEITIDYRQAVSLAKEKLSCQV